MNWKGGPDNLYLGKNTEVRFNEDGTVDELVLRSDDGVILHMEQMDDKFYWLQVKPCQADGKGLTFNIRSDSPIKIDHRID